MIAIHVGSKKLRYNTLILRGLSIIEKFITLIYRKKHTLI